MLAVLLSQCLTQPGALAGENVTTLAAGGYHLVGVTTNGQVLGVGDNAYGQLGDHPTTAILEGLSNIVSVSAGRFHTLALDAGGQVWFCGDQSFEATTPHGTPSPVRMPALVPGLSNIVKIASGARHHLALDSANQLWAWGHNGSGQMGNGNRLEVTAPAVVLSNVVAMAAGAQHSVAIQTNGTVRTWGANESGQLGLGHRTNSLQPQLVPGITHAVHCAAGDDHTLVRLSNGAALAFGLNAHGQLGDGTTTTRTAPVVVSGLSNVIALAAGGAHSAALDATGRAYLWGRNYEGQAGGGPGSALLHLTPRELTEPGIVDALVCGRHFTIWREAASQFTYGLGSSSDGQLIGSAVADAGNTPRYYTPVLIAELSATTAPPVLSISGTIVDAPNPTGLPVFLSQNNAVIGTALPTTNGTYSFNAVLPGTYRVHLEPPPGFAVTPTNRTVILTNQNVAGQDFNVAAPPVPEPDLLALYRFDETNGTSAFDASRITGNGVVSGQYAWQPAGGRLGGALRFAGAGGRVLIADRDLTNSFTAALWVRFDQVAAQQMLIAQGDPFEAQLQMQGSAGGQRFRIRINLNGGVNLITDSTTLPVAGTWYHVAFRYDGTALALFVNGTKESQVTGTGTLTDLNQSWAIGARNNGLFPAFGHVDEVRLYGGALTDEQMHALASPRAFCNSGFEAPEMGTGSAAYASTPVGWQWTGSNEGAGGSNSGISANNTAFTSGNPPAPQGDQVAFLQRQAVLEQLLHLPPGGYQFQWQGAQRGNQGGSTQTFNTSLGERGLGAFTPAGTPYTTQQTPFVFVPDGFHAFRLQGLNPGGGDQTAFLDEFQINVSAQPGFWGWQAQQRGGTTLTSDLDNDGSGDLLEYALGGDPNDPWTPAGLLALPTANDVSVCFTRPVGLPDVSYHLLVSETLSPPTWREAAHPPTVLDLGNGTEQVRYESLRQTIGVKHSLFCRLEVRLL